MKIAFVGKGGSGKTTLAGLFVRTLGERGIPVLAIDADINQHLLQALTGSNLIIPPPPLGIEIDRIKECLSGTNPRIKIFSEMIKTTPPGLGSRLLRINEENSLYEHFVRQIGNIRFMATGGFTEEDLGVKCYHSKTGAVELLLNHIIDTHDEFVVVDMTAGADSFASGIFTRFDATFVVVEPTIKSFSVFEQYRMNAEPYGLSIFAVGNKVQNKQDEEFLHSHLGDKLVGMFRASAFVRAGEQGTFRELADLESENREVIESLIVLGNNQKKNWVKYLEHAILFHHKNAAAWANTAVGKDLSTQIDARFSYPVI